MTILQGKNAIIYGAGGSMGGAVAKALAKAGARLFLTGRSLSSVQKITDEIVSVGGKAEASQVDAVDEQAITNHVAYVKRTAGSVDISFSAIDYQVVQNIPLITMSAEDFIRPVTIAMRNQFLTARAAAQVMKEQRSGVILSLQLRREESAIPTREVLHRRVPPLKRSQKILLLNWAYTVSVL
jgi:NAD(P)-dependent dehydrogenase (short-subunit alcohol dehydrogenase family)